MARICFWGGIRVLACDRLSLFRSRCRSRLSLTHAPDPEHPGPCLFPLHPCRQRPRPQASIRILRRMRTIIPVKYTNGPNISTLLHHHMILSKEREDQHEALTHQSRSRIKKRKRWLVILEGEERRIPSMRKRLSKPIGLGGSAQCNAWRTEA